MAGFATFLCEFLCQRRVVPLCKPRQALGGVLMPVDDDGVLAQQWFAGAQLTGTSRNVNAMFQFLLIRDAVPQTRFWRRARKPRLTRRILRAWSSSTRLHY